MPNPDTERLWRRARHYVAARQVAPAVATLEMVLSRDPTDTEAHLALGSIHASQDHLRAARMQVWRAAEFPPADTTWALNLATAAIGVGEVLIARRILAAPQLANSSSAQILMQVAAHWQLVGEHANALRAIDQARRSGADGREFCFYHALELAFNGQFERATAELRRCIAFAPPFGRAFLQLARSSQQTPESNHRAAIAAALASVPYGSEDEVALEFARYKECEDLHQFDEAWEALVRGNALAHARQPLDSEHAAAIFARLGALTTPRFVEPLHVDDAPGPQPIFIIGMPRSGTTVLERIIGNHSQIQSAGELGAFTQALTWACDHRVPIALPDDETLARLTQIDWAEVRRDYLAQTQWRARGKAYYVDKLPRNWMWAGLIHKALPHARIFNLVRDPMDVCFSNWRVYFGDGFEYAYAYSMSSLLRRYAQYRRMLDHWHKVLPGVIVDVDYARLVRDPEAVAAEVFAHCGVATEPGCADLTRNHTPSATLSVAQVRQPVHARAFGEWESYAHELGDMSAAVRALAAGADAL